MRKKFFREALLQIAIPFLLKKLAPTCKSVSTVGRGRGGAWSPGRGWGGAWHPRAGPGEEPGAQGGAGEEPGAPGRDLGRSLEPKGGTWGVAQTLPL